MQHLQVPLHVCPTCWPDTSGNKTMRAPSLLVGAYVCVCVSDLLEYLLLGLWMLVSVGGAQVPCDVRYAACPPPTLITSSTLFPHRVNHLFVMSSMWIAWPWMRVCRFIYWKLLSLQILYRGSARTKTSIIHSYHTLAQEILSLSWDWCDTRYLVTGVLC